MTQKEFALRSAFANKAMVLSEDNARMGGRLGADYDYSQDDAVKRMLDPRGHGSDRGKMQWHPTFSDQSVYSTPKNPGGRWSRDFQGTTFAPAKGQDTSAFREYMWNQEPNVRVVR